MSSSPSADYGIDAPGVVRNLAVAGIALLAVGVASALHWIPDVLHLGPVSLGVTGSAFGMGIGFSVGAAWMHFGSKYGKVDERNKLLAHINWTGAEHVLDVGCGRGLVLVGAALKLTTGRAVGVDIWQAEDLSGNSSHVPLKNAAIEGVAGRVRGETSDMRAMPFSDGTFDVIVSRAAIHNLYQAADRAAAIREIVRVTKPGGQGAIADIRHISEYIAVFAANGCTATRVDSRVTEVLLGLVTFGSMRPNTLVVRKNG